MSSSDFNAIVLMEDVIAIRKKGKNSTIKSKEIKITDDNMIKLVTAIRELVESLILSKGSWKANNNSFLMTLVQESMRFVKSYKHLSIDDKKRLLLLVIDKVVEQEIKTSEIQEDIKNKLLTGIDEVVEPSIELAIRALKGELKLDENTIIHGLKLIVRLIFVCTSRPNAE
jgi:hypothetical protein